MRQERRSFTWHLIRVMLPTHNFLRYLLKNCLVLLRTAAKIPFSSPLQKRPQDSVHLQPWPCLNLSSGNLIHILSPVLVIPLR